MNSEELAKVNTVRIHVALSLKNKGLCRDLLLMVLTALPDYGRVLALRSVAAAYTELPRYLLAPEVTGQLHHIPDWTQNALINSLWNTGGRLIEVLALRRRDFRLNDTISHVVNRIAKQRRAGSGRP